jgi:two-component system chemotaxis sensor kinase CheA
MPKVRVMDDLLREFLTETGENLDTVDVELVRFEQEPSNAKILGNVFRLVHTIKGTCGFLDLPRLEALTHAAETVMGKLRDGAPVTTEAVSLILATIDRIKEILAVLEGTEQEPPGRDADLIEPLERIATGQAATPMPPQVQAPAYATGTLTYQVLERPLRPGEVSLDELERAFREAPVEAPRIATDAHASDAATPALSEAAFDISESTASEGHEEPRVAQSSIRVGVDTLEQLMTMVSELVLTRNQLLEISRRNEDSEFKSPLQRLSSVTAELQEGVMKARMQPIGNAWQKLPRLVRDLSIELSKGIDLQTFGAETELDRQVLELIKDPLTHMVRNAADHGLETTAERQTLGKPLRGIIRLSARHEGGHIVIEISDDGRGLNVDRIRQKAIAQNLVTEADAAKMSDVQVQRLIFTPGLSTAPQITSISGRGVGMDVVKNNIDQIGGTIDVRSVLGEGSAFVIKIPLTLAIISALIVESAGERFAIPQLAVAELVRCRAGSEHCIEYIKDAPVLRLRNKLLPLIHLGALLKLDDKDRATIDSGYVVMIQIGSQRFGLVVDGLFHTEEIVVKPMASKLRHIGMFSGTAILGDGAVIMILDPNGVAETVGSAGSQANDVAAVPDAASEPVTPLLTFRAGSQARKAVPLSLVARLEEIDCRAIEVSNGRHVVQYRGRLMPLLRVSDDCKIQGEGAQPVLVFSDGVRAMGIVVDDIIDIVEDRLTIDVVGKTPGVIGSAIVKGHATEIIDVGHYLGLAFEGWGRDATPAASATQSVMLVDDSAFFRDMLAPVLKAAGYEVSIHASAADALEALRAGRRPVVILSDIQMPEMDGLQFAAAVRAEVEGAPPPMLALSSHATPSLMERVRAAGFDGFIAKFDRQALIAKIREHTTAWDRAA